MRIRIRTPIAVLSKALEGLQMDRKRQAEEEQRAKMNALADRRLVVDEESNRVLNRLRERDIGTPRLGDANYASSLAGVDRARGDVETDVATDRAMKLKPIEVSKAIEIAQAQPTPKTAIVTTEPGTGRQVVTSFDTRTGKTAPTGDEAKATASGAGLSTGSLKKAIADNRTQIATIDNAIELLQRNPNAVGITKGLGLIPGLGEVAGQVNQRRDPEGEDVRNALQNIESLVFLDRAGKAVTKNEMGRQGFIPNVASRADANLKKLQALRQWALTETAELERVLAPPAAAGGGGARAARPVISQAEYDALRSQGFSDASLRAKYTVQP